MGRLNGFRQFVHFAIAFLLLATSASAASTSTKQTTTTKRVASTSAHSRSKARSKSRRKRVRGQAAIDPVRVREIQAALIRENYLQGQPNGVWDARTKAAMVRYQSENGWQTKKVPDSRAIIKLGLGPDHADLINPDTAFIQPLPGKGGGQGNQ